MEKKSLKRVIRNIELALLSLILPPVALILIWKYRKDWFKRHRIDITLVIAWCAIWILIILCAAANPSPSNISDSQQAKQQTKTKSVPIITTKVETVKSSIPFAKTSQNDSTLAKGETKISQTGVNGEKTTTYSVQYQNGKEISRKQVKSEVTKKPINEIKLVGTYVEPAPTPSAQQPSSSDSTSVYYANCTEAREAGAAPIYRGQPGYRAGLDRDNDGVACE